MSKKDVETKVVEAVSESEKEDNLIRLSTGVVLKGKTAPALALIKVMANFRRPKVPTFFNDKIGREIQNPDDPDYKKALDAYEAEYSSAMLNTLILYGTEIHSIPKKFGSHMGDDWLEKYYAIGLAAQPDNETWRYLNWVLFVAAPAPEDMETIQKVVGRLSGVPEKAVQSAEEFPGSDQES